MKFLSVVGKLTREFLSAGRTHQGILSAGRTLQKISISGVLFRSYLSAGKTQREIRGKNLPGKLAGKIDREILCQRE